MKGDYTVTWSNDHQKYGWDVHHDNSNPGWHTAGWESSREEAERAAVGSGGRRRVAQIFPDDWTDADHA